MLGSLFKSNLNLKTTYTNTKAKKELLQSKKEEAAAK
jgi:hypothetical protein